jgi:hypothetical protein
MVGPTVEPALVGDAELREETISPRLRMIFVERSLAASPTCERTAR